MYFSQSRWMSCLIVIITLLSTYLFDHTAASTVQHDKSFAPDFVLRITSQTYTQSCITKTGVALVNGSSPGPEIRLVEGKTSWIRVYNDIADQNLTMHWHGLTMAVSPFADGTPQASQWPIPPHYFFDYEIRPERGYAGTYFYHSHVGFQAVSVSGPLIVEDAGPVPYEYDEELIILLSDVFNKTDAQIETGLLANPFVWSGESANILVNGHGQLPGRNTTTCTLASLNVKPATTYRLRFIGGTALSLVSLAFEGHDALTIIEADGSYTQPLQTSYLQIGSGQRFSALLKTKTLSALSAAKQNHFYLQLESRERPTLTRSYAVLNYAPTSSLPSTPAIPPLTLPPTTLGFLDYALHPLHPSPSFPPSNAVTRRITIRTHQLAAGTIIWAQNLYPWVDTFPAEPYLVSLYRNDNLETPSLARALAHDGIDPVTRAFPAQIGEVLEVVLQNTGSDSGGVDAHPFHAHGAHYWDLGSGNGTYDAAANERRWEGVGEPVKRDTTVLYRYATTAAVGVDAGWRVWRLRVSEPGVWMVHCHILQHMIMGMQTLWVMGNRTELLTVPEPDVTGYLTYGGSVYGNDTWDPRVVHFKDVA